MANEFCSWGHLRQVHNEHKKAVGRGRIRPEGHRQDHCQRQKRVGVRAAYC